MLYAVQSKRFFETQKAFMFVEEEIDAADFNANEAGVLTFYNDESQPIRSFPPGFWFNVEPAAALPVAPGSSPIIVP